MGWNEALFIEQLLVSNMFYKCIHVVCYYNSNLNFESRNLILPMILVKNELTIKWQKKANGQFNLLPVIGI